MSFNRVIMLGTLVRDPELTQPYANSYVCKISVALNKTWIDREGKKVEDVSYIEVKSYARLAENIAKFFKKGSPILIEGELKQDRWEKDGKKSSKVYVVAEKFEFVQSRAKPADATSAPSDDSNNPF